MARIMETFGRYTGRDMGIDETVYRSKSDTGHRKRAIAHLLYGHGILDRAPEEVLELYFRQCSMLVSARDLAMMAACLANNGVNPVTGMVALKSRYVEKVLSVMSTCGMYHYSGAWIFNVGMPAKSGGGWTESWRYCRGSHELQGELFFGSAEAVALSMLSTFAEIESLVVDFKRVVAIDPASTQILGSLCSRALNEGKPCSSRIAAISINSAEIWRRACTSSGVPAVWASRTQTTQSNGARTSYWPKRTSWLCRWRQ